MNPPDLSAVCLVVRTTRPGEHPHEAGRPRWICRDQVVSSARPAALRWVLLCALALGLIGMHNLAVVDPAHASMGHTAASSTAVVQMPTADEAGMSCCGGDHDPGIGRPGHSSGHEMLHLCLAVLMAAAALIMT
jgi:hypothetical protein